MSIFDIFCLKLYFVCCVEYAKNIVKLNKINKKTEIKKQLKMKINNFFLKIEQW